MVDTNQVLDAGMEQKHAGMELEQASGMGLLGLGFRCIGLETGMDQNQEVGYIDNNLGLCKLDLDCIVQ